MKFLSITIKGLEKQCLEEIGDLLRVDGKISERVVEFECAEEDISKYCYFTQGALKVLELYDVGDVKDVFDVEYKEKLGKDFCVKCKRIGEHNFKSMEVEQRLGTKIWESTGVDVNLKDPETIVYVYIVDNKYYIGKDICKYDISKRDYKIMNNQFSIKGSLAFLMLKFAGYKRGEVLLDPFVKSGEIAIEAALYNLKRSINFFLKNKLPFEGLEKFDIDEDLSKNLIYAYTDNPKYIAAVQKNAKIAEVHKFLNFSRIDIDWIDTKFKKESVDKIITQFSKTKITTEKNFHKSLADFFHQAEYILTPKGVIVVLTRNPDEFVDENFVVDEKIEVGQFYLVRLVKK